MTRPFPIVARCALLLVFLFVLINSRPSAAFDIDDAQGLGITITVSPDRIQWGDEVEVTVRATNGTGKAVQGGLFISFDQDVLVLDVQGGHLLPPGSSVFNLAAMTSKSIKQPMIEAWEETWKAGIERHVTAKVLPLRGPRLRVRARVTFVETSGGQPRMSIAPGRLDSRSLDETGFPTQVGYVRVSQRSTLRRAVRRFERRVRTLEAEDQRQFALALAVALDDPKSFTDISSLGGQDDLANAMRSFGQYAPRISQQLRTDPLVALEKLRCVMASLNCREALVYFGMPMALFEELSEEEAGRLAAHRTIQGEQGADLLILLLEAEGLSIRKDAKTGELSVRLAGKVVKAGPAGPFVLPLLTQIIEALGADALRKQDTVNGMSFASLRALLEEKVPRTGASSGGSPH